MAREAVAGVLRPGDWAIDATLGNGHDCRFLAERVGDAGRVFGFDVQAQAMEQTRRRLADDDLDKRVRLFQRGPERMRVSLPAAAAGRIAAAMFNLGYLPGSDKRLTTRAETSLTAIEQALGLLRTDGLVSVLVYVGHPGGEAEWAALQARLADWQAHGWRVRTRRGDSDRSPVLLLIDRGTPAQS